MPTAVTPDDKNPPEADIRSYLWTLNWSLSFGIQEWDFAAATPAVLEKELAPSDQSRNRFARGLIHAQHVHMIDRPKDEASSAEAIVTDWLKDHLEDKKK